MTHPSFSHCDRVMIASPHLVYTKLKNNVTYGDLWTSALFEQAVELDEASQISIQGNGDRCAVTVTRKLPDDRYLVNLLVTNVITGYFSDQHYVLVHADEMELIESAA